MKQFPAVLFVFLLQSVVFSQNLTSSRRTDWSVAGVEDTIPVYSNIYDFLQYGGANDGITSNNPALQSLLSSISEPSIIYFPTGTYLFDGPVQLKDSVVIRGAGNDSTVFLFNLGGANQNAMIISGNVNPAACAITGNVTKDQFLLGAGACTLQPGNWYHLVFNDTALMYSSWAYGSAGQLVHYKDTTVNGWEEFYYPFRRTITTQELPRLYKVNPISGVGVECLKIVRQDATSGQTSNIVMNCAVNCWIVGVESEMTNFAHIEISRSSNIEVKGNYIHHAHAYGGGGQGYGVALQYSAGQCLIENNVFEHLRHSVLLQSGANGNVIAYNYSTDPNWEEFPQNSAGDLVCHGNFPYLNLFEGNVVQNIVVDNSHGMNGPFNTFYRNRAELYGIVMSSGVYTDSTNFIGNEITNTGFLLGNYLLAGNGNYAYGNNVNGTVQPTGTNTLSDTSLYLKNQPALFPSFVSWPVIGYPVAFNHNIIPAQWRFQHQSYNDCTLNYGIVPDTTSQAGIENFSESVGVYPNPVHDVLTLVLHKNNCRYELYDMKGVLHLAGPAAGEYKLSMDGIIPGVYILKLVTGNRIQYYKIIRQ